MHLPAAAVSLSFLGEELLALLGDGSVMRRHVREGSPRTDETNMIEHDDLGGGFKYFLFSSLPGERIQFD